MVDSIDQITDLMENDDFHQYVVARRLKTSHDDKYTLMFDTEGFNTYPDGAELTITGTGQPQKNTIEEFYYLTIKPIMAGVDVSRTIVTKKQSDAHKMFNEDFTPEDRWAAKGKGIKMTAPFLEGKWYEIKGIYALTYKSSSKANNIEVFGEKFTTKKQNYGWQYFQLSRPYITDRLLMVFNGRTSGGSNWNSFPAIVPVGTPVDPPVCTSGVWDIMTQSCTGNENGRPIANAGDDQTVKVNQQFTLDGTRSSDPNGDILMYKWRKLEGQSPQILGVLESDGSSVGAVVDMVAPPEPTTMVFQLTVSDPAGLESMDTVTINVVSSDPQPPLSESLTVTGDTSCNNEAGNTYTAMSMLKPFMTVHVGDLSYNDDSIQCSVDLSDRTGILPKEYVAIGNHDSSESAGDGIEDEVRRVWNMPSKQEIDGVMFDNLQSYYRVIKSDKKSYFLFLNTQDTSMSKVSSAQFAFAEACLKEANRLRAIGTIYWIYVVFHKPIYSRKSKHSPLRDVRDSYQPLFDEAQVDFVLSGHNHNTQITKPIVYGGNMDASPVVKAVAVNGEYDFTQPHGQIYGLFGGGGRDIYTFDDTQPDWMLYSEIEYQFAEFRYSNDYKQLTLMVHPNNNPVQSDFSLVVRRGEAPPPPPPPPPPTTEYPVKTTWYYADASVTAGGDKTLPSSRYVDEVLLPSGASGVDEHYLKNHWLEIQTGGGNGRLYWDYHRINNKAMEQIEGFGYSTTFTGTFIIDSAENLSIKDGNHGSDGREYDGQYFFGGFGFSIHEGEIQSKVEYYHNVQGSELSFRYPDGLKIEKGREYKFFYVRRTDRNTKSCTINVWIWFGTDKGWIHVVKDRTWTFDNEWKSKASGIPNGKDRNEVMAGASVKCHTIWTRSNSGITRIKNVQYGLPVSV